MANEAYDMWGNAVLVTVTCASCTVPFGLHKPLYDRRKNDGDGFTCPNGHSNVYRDTEAKRLQKELDKEKQRRTWAEADRDRAQEERKRQERRAAAYKGKFKRVKTRVANGVCPCCNRTFQNLMRHMNTKHPKYKKVGLKS